MASSSERLMVVALIAPILLACFCPADAQVTFSRDWKAGKRSAGSDCLTTLPPATSICHMLISELKAVAACEVMAVMRRRGEDISLQEVFETPRSDKR